MEVGEKLAKRGHNVTVVSPHKYHKVPPGITEIVLKNEDYEKFMQKASDDVLDKPGSQIPIGQVIIIAVTI